MAVKNEKEKYPPEAYLGVFLFSVLVVLLTMQVVLRYVFNKNLSWSEELSRMVYVWGVYISFCVAGATRKHIRITFLVDKFSNRVKKVIMFLADLVWIIFNMTLVIQGVLYVLSMRQYPYISAGLGINYMYIYAIVPIGFLVLTIRNIMNMIHRFREGEIVLTDMRQEL